MKNSLLSHVIGTEGNTTPTGNPPQRLWTARIVADCVGYETPVSVLRAYRRGELPGYKFGLRVVRFHPDDVKRWIDAARVAGKRGAE
jgi:hypothetical protein